MNFGPDYLSVSAEVEINGRRFVSHRSVDARAWTDEGFREALLADLKARLIEEILPHFNPTVRVLQG